MKWYEAIGGREATLHEKLYGRSEAMIFNDGPVKTPEEREIETLERMITVTRHVT